MELNADVGESWYDDRVGDDASLLRFLDACNIACGMHGGDALTMQRTIDLALEHGVAIGAHPGYPDRRNFGRRAMELEPARLEALLSYQIGALAAMVARSGGRLHHVKPHGALYHRANADPTVADLVARVTADLDVPMLYGPPLGQLRRAAAARDRLFYAEGFADRRYADDLSLLPRTSVGACLEEVTEVIEQVAGFGRGEVRTADGQFRKVEIDTLCIHGDHPGAVERAKAVRRYLDATLPRR